MFATCNRNVTRGAHLVPTTCGRLWRIPVNSTHQKDVHEDGGPVTSESSPGHTPPPAQCTLAEIPRLRQGPYPHRSAAAEVGDGNRLCAAARPPRPPAAASLCPHPSSSSSSDAAAVRMPLLFGRRCGSDAVAVLMPLGESRSAARTRVTGPRRRGARISASPAGYGMA
eukprot:gene17574-biopygen10691